jgi:hypothetical protein
MPDDPWMFSGKRWEEKPHPFFKPPVSCGTSLAKTKHFLTGDQYRSHAVTIQG